MIPALEAHDSRIELKNRVFGVYPTPLERVSSTSAPWRSGCELWVKRDDRAGTTYGGNKVRKLAHLIADARARGARRLVTIGAAGSHHVLATTIYGRAFGLEVHAVLVPQPRTEHAVANVRAAIGAGLHAHPAFAYAAAPFVLAPLLFAKGTYFVPLGGTSVVGSMGYVDAARELAAQVRAGAMPEPDAIVVTLGSGGTAAGLAAGLALEGLRTRVIAVCIAEPWWVLGWMARRMSRACVKRAGGAAIAAVATRLEIERRYVGKGYAHPTEAGARAIAIGAAMGLTLDPTYTAKTFAAVLDRLDTSDAKTLLYWHTLSSAPLAPLLASAPAEDAIDPRVRRLFV